jgi:hypothetical protein
MLLSAIAEALKRQYKLVTLIIHQGAEHGKKRNVPVNELEVRRKWQKVCDKAVVLSTMRGGLMKWSELRAILLEEDIYRNNFNFSSDSFEDKNDAFTLTAKEATGLDKMKVRSGEWR